MELSVHYQRINATVLEPSEDASNSQDLEQASVSSEQTTAVSHRFPLQKLRNFWQRQGTRLKGFLTENNKGSALSLSGLLLLFIVVPVGLGLYAFLNYHFQIEYSLAAFQIPNHNASKHYDAYVLAKQQTTPFLLKSDSFPRRKRDTSDTIKRWSGSYGGLPRKDQTTVKWHMDLVYVAKGDDDLNIFREDRLRDIHRVEQLILSHKDFQNFCFKRPSLTGVSPALTSKFGGCVPPLSLSNFFFPSYVFGLVIPDGQGELSDVHETVKFLLSQSSTYWFVDNNFSRDNPKSRWLRAQVYFGFPLPGFNGVYKGPLVQEQHEVFKKFIITYIDTLKKASTSKVQVLYGGSEIYDYEVQTTLLSDLRLAMVSLGMIVLLVFILTSFSFFLTIMGIISICMCFPLAYFIYRVVFGVSTMGILNGASVFVIIGIGVDDIFVLINTFRQAGHIDNIVDRLLHTLRVGGKATFFTSFTTAGAFAGNCASQIPAVYEFGLFMALIVVSCWLTVFFITPATLYIWYFYISPLEDKLFSCCRCSVCGSCGCSMVRWALPSEVVQFLSGKKATGSCSANNTTLDDSDFNIDVEMEDVYNIGTTTMTDASDPSETVLSSFDADIATVFEEDDVALLDLNEGNTGSQRTPNNNNEQCSVVTVLQKMLFHWIAKPVIKLRYVILGVYIVLMILSGFGMSRLMVSKHPPAFFQRDTNLQQLLDLKSNMSSTEGICRECLELFSNLANTQPTTSTDTMEPTSEDAVSHAPTNPNTGQATTPYPPLTTPTTHQDCNEVDCTSNSSTAAPRLTTTSSSSTAGNQTTNTTTTTHAPEITTQQSTTKPPQVIKTTEHAMTMPKRTTPGRPGLCEEMKSCEPVDKPVLDRTVTVYVVFGVKGVDRSGITGEHVLGGKGNVVFDTGFRMDISRDLAHLFFGGSLDYAISNLCTICKKISANKTLVLKDGADCFPDANYYTYFQKRKIKDCEGLQAPLRLKGAKPKSYVGRDSHHLITTFAMAFETTTLLNQTPSEIYKSYNEWEDFINNQVLVGNISESLRSGFQTSQVWVTMFSELLAVNGAIYGIVLSLFTCMVAVVVFTGHVMLSFVVLLTILGVVCSVVAVFYLAGWELGAVEAVSLSILVGTSVDYCVHLVEGYILAGDYAPKMKNKGMRAWRSSAAVAHIGVSIISSALTTLCAALPLCLTTIVLFAKFGEIVAINTAMSIFFTLTVCLGFLSIVGPAKYKRSLLSSFIGFCVMVLVFGAMILSVYVASQYGWSFPRPDGTPLFKWGSQEHLITFGLDKL